MAIWIGVCCGEPKAEETRVASRARRSLPDNLDPLVDTLSNVVGILVIVVALTQLQIGDALARVAELDFLRMREEQTRASVRVEVGGLEARQDALFRRTDASVEEAILLARQTLEALSALRTERPRRVETRSLDELKQRLESSQRAMRENLAVRDRREQYAERLQRVPKQMVARLPDPVVVQGRESWILVRYGRIYLIDREKLFEQGSRAIGRILEDGGTRRIRSDEFDAVARYLRKRDVGIGDFHWQMQTEPDVRVELAWRSREGGLEPVDLETSPELHSWLALRSPDVDFIQFQVWGDSFEAYLAAREVVEGAGFRAGWRGHEVTEELDLSLRFGPPSPPVGPVVVD